MKYGRHSPGSLMGNRVTSNMRNSLRVSLFRKTR